jgi:hypothetical protein
MDILDMDNSMDKLEDVIMNDQYMDNLLDHKRGKTEFPYSMEQR